MCPYRAEPEGFAGDCCCLMATHAAFGFFSEDGLAGKSHPTEPAVQVIARTDRSPRNSQPLKQRTAGFVFVRACMNTERKCITRLQLAYCAARAFLGRAKRTNAGGRQQLMLILSCLLRSCLDAKNFRCKIL